MFESVYSSPLYDGRGQLKKYNKLLKKINQRTDYYRALSDSKLYSIILDWDHFDIKNKKHIIELYAQIREVCWRKLGKFQYDVQILGALAALERQMVQMSTGSGKTITLILPTIAYGLTHKGVNVLTVNEYLSKRDWSETKVIYDAFGLTNAYTSNDESPQEQARAFACDITYSTNSTLGFAYLNSALASGIGQDIKPINRPLHAAIIDEVDEILMDDARNPLIIAESSDLGSELATVEHNGRIFSIKDMVETLKTLKYLHYDEETGEAEMSDKTWDEVQELFNVDHSIFENHFFVHVVTSAIDAIFKHKAYVDYVVASEPDPDSGSYIVLIDKATGRLAKGRTLNDNLHAFVEMKEGVFTGVGSSSSIQITYQVLFNIFPNITGVTGTLGTSFKEFERIYGASVVVIPDRLPNKLKQYTHVYQTQQLLLEAIEKKIAIYQSSRHPILIGGASDVEAAIISDYLKQRKIEHRLLLSTDTDEEYVVAQAGQVGSVVVTTDIMGRGTDIHIAETEHERGLVVLQVGSRPNSRVERQFAGRAARQGDPGRYHRMLSLPELPGIGVMESSMKTITQLIRENRNSIRDYEGDILLDGYAPYYNTVVGIIDESLNAQESAVSSSRVSDFYSSSITDLIQVSLVSQMDIIRLAIRETQQTGNRESLLNALTQFSLSDKDFKKKKIARQTKDKWNQYDSQELMLHAYQYTEHIMHEQLQKLREYSEGALKTSNLTSVVKLEVKPEDYMSRLMHKYMEEHESEFQIQFPDIKKYA